MLANACSTLAGRGLAVVVGYQVYEFSKSPLALGLLGLVEAVPALSLALYGGHVADRSDRRSILRTTLGALVVCAASFALLTLNAGGSATLPLLYGVVFIAGIARGFAAPAAAALEAQIVPRDLLVQSSSWLSAAWLGCAVVGPVLAGLSFSYLGPSATYLGIASLYAAAGLCVLGIAPRPPIPRADTESVWASIAAGIRYVARDQVLVGSMALDLFAVLFGGAIALLPLFAEDVLGVDAFGLGCLNAAPAVGALATMLLATQRPPVRHAGRNLLLSVAGFGVAMIAFALAENFYLSLLALAAAGAFDGVSVVIRKSILRLMSPDNMRGRIAAISFIFIGSSNELGALESGLAAAWLGPQRSVWAGGLVTLLVVALAAALAPRLRGLRLDPTQAAARDAKSDDELERA